MAQSGTDSEVAARARRRVFSNAEKRRILEAVKRCTEPGVLGALMRRDDMYSSSLSTWRRQREAFDLTALAPGKRGPKVDADRAECAGLRKLRPVNPSRNGARRSADREEGCEIMAGQGRSFGR